MSVDPHRERDLAGLGVTAHVDTDSDLCTVAMTTAAFDRLVTAVAVKVHEPPWFDRIKDAIEDAEVALRQATYEIRQFDHRARRPIPDNAGGPGHG